jgi:protein gp37
MSDNSAIEWTTHTFNPWWGCSRGERVTGGDVEHNGALRDLRDR